MNHSVLVVDDDRFLADAIRKLFESNGMDVKLAHNGRDAISAVTDSQPDLVVLDLGLPDVDGISLCRRMRQEWHFPILMLTSRSGAVDKVVGLEVGADDYLCKPFESAELLARVRAQLRRTHEYVGAAAPIERKFSFGPLVLDEDARTVFVGDKLLDLTETEFKILHFLAANPQRAISRERLFETVWGYEIDFNSNSLEVMVYRLRSKIQRAGGPNLIQTIRGFGYKVDL